MFDEHILLLNAPKCRILTKHFQNCWVCYPGSLQWKGATPSQGATPSRRHFIRHDTFLCYDVPLRDRVDTASHLRGQPPPKKTQFRIFRIVNICVFKPNVQFHITKSSKLLHRFQSNFAQWQKPPSSLLFVGRPKISPLFQDGGRSASWKKW